MFVRSALFVVCCFSMIIAKGQFSPPKIISRELLDAAYWLTKGDFDNDDDIDLVAGGISGGVVLFLNTDGEGSFEAIPVADSEEMSVYSVHMVDVDADGLMDVVVDATLILWARNLGGNHFAAFVALPNIESGHHGVQFDDSDGDGDMDAYMFRYPDELQRMENLGGGQFAEPVQIGEVRVNGQILLLDFDADGDRDIAVGYEDIFSDGGQVRLFRHETDGTYVVQETYTQPDCDGTVTWEIFGYMRTWDQDGDGLDDLILPTDCYGTIGWRRSFGELGFASSADLATFSEVPLSLTWVDVDGDGIEDLLALTENGIERAQGLGNNTYGTPTNIMHYPESAMPARHIVADVNADGRPELFTTLGSFNRVYHQAFLGDGTVELRAVLTDYVPDYFEYMRIADLNADGLPDVLRTHFLEGLVVAYTNLGPMGFSEPKIVIDSDSNVNQIELADMDDNGDLDVVLYDDSVHIYTNQGGFSFVKVASFRPTGISYADEFMCADMDADGDVDLMFTVQGGISRIRNNGNNSFTTLGTTPALAWPLRPKLHGFMDVDEDGDLDVLATYNAGALEWVRNDGGMAFGARSFFANGSYADHLEVVDMDGDGHLDLFGTQNYNNDGARAFWMKNSGGGVFGPSISLLEANIQAPCSPRPVDVDNDGDKDVVIALQGGGVFLENLGEDGFGVVQPLSTVPWRAKLTKHDRAFDMDGDGDEDFVFYYEENVPPSMYGVAWVENFGADPYELTGNIFADLNGDGLRGAEDPGLPGVWLTTDPAGYLVLGLNGSYSVHCQPGAYLLSAISPGSLWEQSTTPVAYSVEPNETQPLFSGLDFGFAPTQDVSVIVPEVSLSPAVCSDTTSFWVSVLNEGTREDGGSISLTLDPAFTFVTSQPPPSSVNGEVINWEFDSLSFGALLTIHAEVVMPGAELIGEAYTHSIQVSTMDQEGEGTGSFHANTDGVIACSFDPNDKQVSPVGYGYFGAVEVDQDRLVYTVRFQNTGTAPAVDLMIRDQLSASLDLTSIHFLGSSHSPTEMSISPSGELVVRFANIQLPDSGSSFTGSQGFIRFRMELLPGQLHLTEVRNTAEIYFDLNEEVVTNTVRNTLVDCALWEPMIDLLGGLVLEATEGDDYQWYLNGEAQEGETARTTLIDGAGVYTVSVRSVYGCEAFSEPFLSTGIDRTSASHFRAAVVPNPSISGAQLFLSEDLGPQDAIVIIDGQGREVGTRVGLRGHIVLIPRDGLASGLYFLRVMRDGVDIGGARMVIE